MSAVTAGSPLHSDRRNFSQTYSGAPNAAFVAKPLPRQRFTHESPSAEGSSPAHRRDTTDSHRVFDNDLMLAGIVRTAVIFG